MVTVRVYPSVGVEEPGTEAGGRPSLALMNPPNGVSFVTCVLSSLGHVVISRDGWGLSVCLCVPRCEDLLHTGAGTGSSRERWGGGLWLSEWPLVPQRPESVHSMHRRWLEGILTSRGRAVRPRTLDSGEVLEDDSAKEVCILILMGVMQLLQKLPPKLPPNCIGSRLRSPRVGQAGTCAPVVDEPRSSLHSSRVVINQQVARAPLRSR